MKKTEKWHIYVCLPCGLEYSFPIRQPGKVICEKCKREMKKDK